MLIGALSKASGFSRDTIRFYEKIGLLEIPARKRAGTQYKDYPDTALQTLFAIRNLKNLGFTLEEIREIIIRQQMKALDTKTSLRIIEQKIIHLDTQVDKLLQYKERLEEARVRMHETKSIEFTRLTEIGMCA